MRRGSASATRMKYSGTAMTFGNAGKAGVRLIVMVPGLRPLGRADPAEMAERYGAETAVIEWRERLVCSGCGNRQVDMVVSGTELR